ncbi:MAG TPA: FMN-binding protein [bacterium]|nr:FMN-binding protein [bacterium]
MNKGLYTVYFMVAVSIVFFAALSVMNELTRPQIRENQEVQRLQSILYAADILPEGIKEIDWPAATTNDFPWDREWMRRIKETRFREIRLPLDFIEKKSLDDRMTELGDTLNIIAVLDEEGRLEGYGFPIHGKGLWGTISAFVVLDRNLQAMIGIDFTEQMETPGLGARITENGFKYFFRGLDLSGFTKSMNYPIQMVREKRASNREISTREIQSITGATQTCNGVLSMLNTNLDFYIRFIEAHEQEIETIVLGAH